jgi:hypothetical protein
MLKHATLWCSLFVCLPGFALAQGAPKDAEILARQVVAAIVAGDQSTLQTLTIDQAEFKKYILPTFAVRNAGDAKAYTIYMQNSDVGLKHHLALISGKKVEVVNVRTEPARAYKGYRMLPNPEITLRWEDGQQQVLKLGGALLDHDGQVKVATYYRTPSTAT